MAVLETTRTLRRHHEQCKEALIRQTTLCDGTSPAGVRAWFKHIELAGAKVGAENQIEIAARTAAGSLRWELERYIAGVLATNDQINVRSNVPWADVKAHLRTSFLNVDDSSALRHEVEKTRQSAYEPEASFSRRFREVADTAYAREGRNEAFARGLRSDELPRKLVEEGNPTTLEEAFTTLAGHPTAETLAEQGAAPDKGSKVGGPGKATTDHCCSCDSASIPGERTRTTPAYCARARGWLDFGRKTSLLRVRPRGPHAPRVPLKPCGKRTEVVGVVSGRPVVDLQVGGLSIGALVDTGASCTLLRLDIFHTLADRAHRHRLLADAPALRGVSGASLDVRGSTEIKIQGVAKPIWVTVLGDLPCKMVLGQDALQDGQGIIDFDRNVLRWHRREWPMRRIAHAFEASLGQVLPETGDEQINQLILENTDLFSAKPNGFCSNSPIHS